MDLGAISGILKETYLPAIRSQINETLILLQRLERRVEDIVGGKAKISMQLMRSEGVGARGLEEPLPEAGQPTVEQATIPLKLNYAVGSIPGPAIKASESDEGAFISAVDLIMKSLTSDLRRDINIQLFGDSSGVLAKTAAAGANTRDIRVDVVKYFGQGMRIDMEGVFDNERIISVNVATKTIRVTNPYTFSAGRKIYRHRNKDRVIMGLKGIVDDGTYVDNFQGLLRSQYDVLKSYVNSNGGVLRPISEDLVQQVFDGIDIKSGLSPTLIICSHGVKRAYANLLINLKRFVQDVTLRGGYVGVMCNEVPMIADRDCPDNTAFFLNEDHLAIYPLTDFEFRDVAGSVLLPELGVDRYQIQLQWYSECGSDFPAASGVLRDIQES